MNGLRILIANMALKDRSGTEIVTMELARGLIGRGHDVVVYSPDLGESAEALRRHGVTVVGRLDDLDFEPQVVHGNHSVDLVQGMIAFPAAAGVFVCHNPLHWLCTPPDLSRVRAFVSVDRLGCARIATDLPRVRDSIRLVHNAVDLSRYQPRPGLPARPRRALVLTKFTNCLPDIQTACQRSGLDVEFLGPGVERVVDDLHVRLMQADIVFATARMAIEAMAVGCAVVVVDDRGLAGLVTDDVVADWRDDNFGRKILTEAITVEALAREIARYDPVDAARVCAYVRSHNSLDRALSIYEEIYTQAIAANLPIDPRVEAREMSRLMRYWLPNMGGDVPVPGFVRDGEESRAPSNPVRFLLSQVDRLSAQLLESEADRRNRLEQVHVLTAALAESDADRRSRLEQIHVLTAALQEPDADRSSRRQQISDFTARWGKSGARSSPKFYLIRELVALVRKLRR